MFIFDASTLVLLGRADLLDLLLDDYPATIAVPEAVEHECTQSSLRPDGIPIREHDVWKVDGYLQSLEHARSVW